MGGSVSSNTAEALKNQIDIVDVIGRVVTLKKAGSTYKGLCPFHNEKTPSFSVNAEGQYYHCFGCGESGDLISFVQKYYNLNFQEAAEKLAEEYGITLERRNYRDNRNEYYEINRMAAQFFYDSFTKKANRGYGYMKSRGIAPATLKRFGIGYADGEWDSLYQYLHAKGVDDEKMIELGLVSRGKGNKCYDYFRERVMFPIINTSKKVIGFGGRAILPDERAKYLNSKESIIFQKKDNLYGLNLARQAMGKQEYGILVEGYMDVIALHQSGVYNVAASLGTALTKQQAHLLHRYVKEVILSYDADAAGRKAAMRGIEILREERCKVRVLHVTDGKDPDEYIKNHGRDAFLKLIEGAVPYGEYKIESAKRKYNLSSEDGVLDFIHEAVRIMAELDPIEQAVYKQKIARDLGISESALDQALRAQPRERSQRRSREMLEGREETTAVTVTPLEKTLLKLAMTDEDFIPLMQEEKEALFQSEAAQVIFRVLTEVWDTSSYLDQNLIIDQLPPAHASLLVDILEQVALDVNHETVFQECLNTARLTRLAKREKELLMQLSMVDETMDASVIKNIQDELMQIQQKKRQL